jgi:aryl-alcohol dehydrogenase-like predicted oxidoreductase
VILGASKKNHLEETLKSVNDLALISEEVSEKIEGILNNKPVHPQW